MIDDSPPKSLLSLCMFGVIHNCDECMKWSTQGNDIFFLLEQFIQQITIPLKTLFSVHICVGVFLMFGFPSMHSFLFVDMHVHAARRKNVSHMLKSECSKWAKDMPKSFKSLEIVCFMLLLKFTSSSKSNIVISVNFAKMQCSLE